MKCNYSLEEKDLIGKKIAELFMLRKDRENPGRFKTYWGNKTAVGIFETVKRLGEEMEEGTLTSSLLNN